MQQDPRAAILKYQKDPAVSTMLRDFMEFLGNHFEEVRVDTHQVELVPSRSDGHVNCDNNVRLALL